MEISQHKHTVLWSVLSAFLGLIRCVLTPLTLLSVCGLKIPCVMHKYFQQCRICVPIDSILADAHFMY